MVCVLTDWDGVGLLMAFHFGSVSRCGSLLGDSVAARHLAWGALKGSERDAFFSLWIFLFFFLEVTGQGKGARLAVPAWVTSGDASIGNSASAADV